jgi:DNA replication protein DnaC
VPNVDPTADDTLQTLRQINPELANVLDQLRPYVRSDEEIERREHGRKIAARLARADVGREAYMNHLPDRLRRMAETPITQHPANQHAVEVSLKLKLGENLYLSGPRGTGKTHLALRTALRMIHDHGVTAKFWAWDDYINAVLATFQQDRQPESLVQHEVLILDDIDKRTGRTDFVSEQLWNVLQRLNYDQTKTTIITANHPAPKVAKQFFNGDTENQAALASRLTYYMHNVHVGRKDRRADG